jgi:lipopolysaccharide export system protein LptA
MTALRLLTLIGLLGAASLASAADGPSTDIQCENYSSSTSGDETTAICTVDVRVVSGDLRITCDYLKAISDTPKGAPAGSPPQFRYLLATGHVHILQGDVDATSGQAEVFPQEGRMVLTDHPVVTDHAKGATFTADPLVRWRDGRMEGKNFHAVATSLKELGLDQKPAAPAPAPAPAAQP